MDEKPPVTRPLDDEAVGLARRLLREARYGSLATLDPDSGAPMASRVAVATDVDGTPLILVSALAAHSVALRADPRCSLLVGEPGKGDPLAHPRMTIACLAKEVQRGTPTSLRVARRYLARQPKAKLYADFPDFAYFILDPTAASLNGGFGKAFTLAPADLLLPRPSDGFVNAEASALAHMNAEHADAVAVYAMAFANGGAGAWTLTGIDPEGIDVMSGELTARVLFPKQLAAPSEMRTALVQMAVDGRSRLDMKGSHSE